MSRKGKGENRKEIGGKRKQSGRDGGKWREEGIVQRRKWRKEQ